MRMHVMYMRMHAMHAMYAVLRGEFLENSSYQSLPNECQNYNKIHFQSNSYIPCPVQSYLRNLHHHTQQVLHDVTNGFPIKF